jgi:hypothetical protein
LRAQVQTNGVNISRVDFFADRQLLGTVRAAPWTLTWTNAWAGTNNLIAMAVDENGLSIGSEPVRVNLIAAPPLADQIASETVQPNWRSTYGSLGRAIPGVLTNLPYRVSINIPGSAAQQYSKPGVLPDDQKAWPATAWIAPGKLSVAYRPGNETPHRLSLLFAPYETAKSLTVSLLDPSTGATLDKQIVTGFENGRFVSWAVHGAIDIDIRAEAPLYASLSGMFIDSLLTPSVKLLPTTEKVTLPATIVLAAEAWSEGRRIARVEFWDGNVKLGEALQAPYEFRWRDALAGEHSFTAVAVDEYGLAIRSQAKQITCALPMARAIFIGEDRSTSGNWIGSYGRIGQVVVSGWTNLPPSLTFGATGTPYTFSDSGFEEFSLQRPEAQGRLAACYFVDSNATLELRAAVRHGKPTRLSLYFLDWFGPGRLEQVQILDAVSGVELDRRTTGPFTDGVYLSWNVRGDVRAVIQSLNDFNTVVSAAFFDPAAPEINTWLEGQSITIELVSPPAPDLAISVETSTNLVDWEPAKISRADSGGMIRFTGGVIGTGPNFYRLRFTEP